MGFIESIRISKPRVRMVHGVRITKAPIGRYLDILADASGLVLELVDAAFPGMKPEQILHALTTLTQDDLAALIKRLLAVVPEAALKIAARMLDVEYAWLRSTLTPGELISVLAAFFKENNYDDFFQNARTLATAIHPRTKQTPGSNAGSPADFPPGSESAS